MPNLQMHSKRNMFPRGYDTDRTITDTLNLGWKLLSILPVGELKRIRQEYIDKYLPKKESGSNGRWLD